MKKVTIVDRAAGKAEWLYLLEKDPSLRKIAEIGVYNGEGASAFLLRIPGIELYLIDPYKVYKDPAILDNQKVHNARYKMMKLIVEQAKDKGKNVTLLRKTSMAALEDIPDGYLDVVYIDADHSYNSIKEDLEGWYKKLRIGGMLAGHDFWQFQISVGNAVIEFVEKYNLSLNFYIYGDIWVTQKK